jgi:ELWxxDGT repeat protein
MKQFSRRRVACAALIGAALLAPSAYANDEVVHGVGAFAPLAELEPGPRPVSGVRSNQLFMALGEHVLFSAYPDGLNPSLWRSDGSDAGTTLVKRPSVGRETGIDSRSIVLNGTLLYTAHDGHTGYELWRSDGTPDGTYQLKDTLPGANDGYPNRFVKAGGRAFFVADAESRRAETLWVTDGTRDGTQPLKTFANSIGALFVTSDGTLLFTSDEAAYGVELWRSDGTPGGTQRVADINPGANDAAPSGFFELQPGVVLFSAQTDAAGRELWLTDGSTAGTYLLKDLAENSRINRDGSPGILAALSITSTEGGSTLRQALFVAKNGDGKGSLWVTNGLADVVIPPDIVVRNTRQIFESSDNGFFQPTMIGVRTLTTTESVYDLAIFGVSSGQTPSGIYVSDGSAAGTIRISDATLDTIVSDVDVRVGDVYFFRASFGVLGRQLWRSDGTRNGTRRVSDLPVSAGYESPIVAHNGRVFFIAHHPAQGRELYVADGSGDTVALLRDIMPGPQDGATHLLGGHGRWLYFLGNDGAGEELWRSDGTPAGTERVKNIAPDVASGGFDLETDTPFAATDTYLYAASLTVTGQPEDYPLIGLSLWASSGAPGAGQRILAPPAQPGAFFAGSLITMTRVENGARRQVALFDVPTGLFASELWRVDGTSTPTRVNAFASPTRTLISDMRPFGDLAIVSVMTDASKSSRGYSLWRSDGTAQGAQLLHNNVSVQGARHAVLGNTMIFAGLGSDADNLQVHGLWRTDGTPAGTALISRTMSMAYEVTAGPGSSAYYVLIDDARGQLWKTDGTLAGTVLVTGTLNSNRPRWLTAAAGTLFFVSRDAAVGLELWKTDGTTAGTVLVSDIYPGAGWSAPAELIAYKNALYFSATGPDGVRTLWRSDGSAAGTAPVRAGTGAPIDPSHMRVVDGQLFFSAGDPAYGRELWRSDGSAAGTVLHQDIAPGAVSSNAQPIAANGTHLFVQAYTPQAGRELFAAPIGALQTPPTPPPPSTTTPVRGARKLHLPVVQRR